MKTVILILIASLTISAQPWNYNLGSGSGSFTSGTSTTFLPDPQTGGGSDARVCIGTSGGSFNLDNQIISFGTQTYLRGTPGRWAVNKFSVYDYSPGNSFTIRFRVRFGDTDGGTTSSVDGQWYFMIGDGTKFSNNDPLYNWDPQIFAGISWDFGSGSALTTYYLESVWTELSGTPFSQGQTYIVDIYGNNSSSAINYTYGTSQSIASNKVDIWVNGTLIGDDLVKSPAFAGLANIDSWMFYGYLSDIAPYNTANIFIDDISYSNSILSEPLPVELSSFTAAIKNGGIQLNWTTKTEINNYGFDIERSSSSRLPDRQALGTTWNKIGFVEGSGNSNSPKEYSFIDDEIKYGKYFYRLKQTDNDGSIEYSKIVEVDAGNLADEFTLGQNFPNPFNPSTKIKFALRNDRVVLLNVYDVLGIRVATLFDGKAEANKIYEVEFDATELSSGIYIYRLESDSFFESRKMLLVK